MKKICIIGGSGTGKTTLAKNLSREYGIQVYHLDGINYLENWNTRDKEERDKIILDIINKDEWITDGTYSTTLKERVEKAEYVIYLDYSTFAQIVGVMKRFFKNHGKSRNEIAGCKEQMNMKFFLFVLNWRKNKRQLIIDILKEKDKSKVQIFKNRFQLNKWYKEKFGKKIVLY